MPVILAAHYEHLSVSLQRDPDVSIITTPFPSLCWASQISQEVVAEEGKLGIILRFTSKTAMCYLALFRTHTRGAYPIPILSPVCLT